MYTNLIERKMMWKLEWREDAPEKYQVSQKTRDAIVHSIDGLDPHEPYFQRDRCYIWKLWNCMGIREIKGTEDRRVQIHIRTPMTSKQCGRTQNLKTLLAYHYFGYVDSPETSSRNPCPCGSELNYGSCCFPTIHMACHVHTGIYDSGQCVNPMHFVTGTNSDTEFISSGPYREPEIRECKPCLTCNWTPYEFLATDRITGYHEQACKFKMPLNHETVHYAKEMFEQWKREAIQNCIHNMSDENDVESMRKCVDMRNYLNRYYKLK